LEERRYSSYPFLNSALDGVSGQPHSPAALYPWGKDARYPLDRRLGGHQSRYGHRGWRKNPLSLAGIETRSPGRPVPSQKTILTELRTNTNTIIFYLHFTFTDMYNLILHNSLSIFYLYIYCYMLGFLGGVTYAPCSISMVTQQLLLPNSEFVAFPW
jgi:hypothetical protein